MLNKVQNIYQGKCLGIEQRGGGSSGEESPREPDDLQSSCERQEPRIANVAFVSHRLRRLRLGSDLRDGPVLLPAPPRLADQVWFELLWQNLSTSQLADQDPLRCSRPLAQRVASKRRPGGRAQDDRQRGQDHCGSQSFDLRPTTGCVFRNIFLTRSNNLSRRPTSPVHALCGRLGEERKGTDGPKALPSLSSSSFS